MKSVFIPTRAYIGLIERGIIAWCNIYLDLMSFVLEKTGQDHIRVPFSQQGTNGLTPGLLQHP